MKSLKSDKTRTIIEIAAGFLLMSLFIFVFNILSALFNTDSLWIAVMTYIFPAVIIILYVTRVEKKPVAYIGVKFPLLSDIPGGLLLGLCMFIIQQIPLLLMKMDYTPYAAKPDWNNIIVMSLFLILCVGFVEELIFRGFILRKTQELCKSEIINIAINCLLFYMIHWQIPFQFVLGELFSPVVNTILLCTYFYKSKNKSIFPLVIAHGFYDIMTSYLLPAFLFIK